MTPTTVIIDGSNQWYRAYSVGIQHMDAPGGPVSIMTFMLRKICRQYGLDNVIICWDAGDGGRKTIDPEYKAQRQSIPGVWEDIVYMKTMVDACGIKNSHKKGFEADDVCGSIAKNCDKALILSYDKDFYQLVDEQVQVLRPGRTVMGKQIPEKIVDRDAVIEEYGCTPDKLRIYKAFMGDKSDNIPKCPIRFTKKFKAGFFAALAKSYDIKDFYEQLELFDSKYHEPLLDFKDRAQTNYNLVGIQTGLDVLVENPRGDRDKFEKLCEEMEITRLKFDDWKNMPKDQAPPPPIQNTLF